MADLKPIDVPDHEIVVVHTEQDVQQCYDVRVEVFHHEQKFPLDTEFDAYDTISAHFLLRLTPSLVPVGTVRAYKSPDANYYKLSRLAVLIDYRKFGFGRQLVSALHDWVAADARQRGEIGFTDVVLHSQLHAKGFYGKFGYESQGAEFDEDGDPHQKMVLRLPL